MKRFFLWIIGVALGAALFLGAAFGVSYYFTTESDLPAQTAAFGDVTLEANGWCWQVPLIGGAADRAFASATTLSVQKLGTLSDAHPALALPEWATRVELSVSDESDRQLFSGTAEDYAAFTFPSNGGYKVRLQLWHLPKGMDAKAFTWPSNGAVLRDAGLEHPAQPTGCYDYTFRFTLSASPEVKLSSTGASQGGVFGLLVTGVLGADAPKLESDLGAVSFTKTEAGWLGYLPVAYNASAGKHTITVTCTDETVAAEVKVTMRNYGNAVAPDEPEAPEGAGQQFRDAIWPLYTAASGAPAWAGAWVCPVEQHTITVGYGVTKSTGGQSNSSLLATTAGSEVKAPTGGTVVYAGELLLTGKTIVIDHGCGVRTYLYGLSDIWVKKGDAVLQNGPVGLAGDTLTLDVKIGSRSIDPWALFRGSGGLFWQGTSK